MMTMSQQVITIALCVAGTMLTRFLPFAVFNGKRPTPRYIQYLGKVLPGAVFAMLVIYCLRNVSFICGSGKCCFLSQEGRSVICCWYSFCFEDEGLECPL